MTSSLIAAPAANNDEVKVVKTIEDEGGTVLVYSDNTVKVVEFMPQRGEATVEDPTSWHCRSLQGLEGREKWREQEQIASFNENLSEKIGSDEEVQGGEGELCLSTSDIDGIRYAIEDALGDGETMTLAQADRGFCFDEARFRIIADESFEDFVENLPDGVLTQDQLDSLQIDESQYVYDINSKMFVLQEVG